MFKIKIFSTIKAKPYPHLFYLIGSDEDMLVLSSPATSLELLASSTSGEYYCPVPLNLYNSPTGEELATQAATQRHIKLLEKTITNQFIQVQLCEDGYLAWLSLNDLPTLKSAPENYKHKKYLVSKLQSVSLKLLLLLRQQWHNLITIFGVGQLLLIMIVRDSCKLPFLHQESGYRGILISKKTSYKRFLMRNYYQEI
ncbi:NLP/P60 [Crocosphaera watsonii WH 0402]|uniref:NLP/P60 n=1 Tax=Crocosphaera watsonii WH 0402 TaxID=1284629 RepID=T2JW22_CROWT|nr:NLP/P60 [Crocosphaera watsonii WH 0402]